MSPTVGDARAFRRDLTRWGKANRRSFPWRETDDPFRILVAEVLLQRSRGKTVAKVFEQLFERWPDAASLARARVDTIEKVIRPLGLNKRAGTLKGMAAVVSGLGEVPSTLDGLLALPGVGPYAAGATLAVAFDKRAPVVTIRSGTGRSWIWPRPSACRRFRGVMSVRSWLIVAGRRATADRRRPVLGSEPSDHRHVILSAFLPRGWG